MEGPWKHNPWYSILRLYVDACTRNSYRVVRIEGRENIPSNAAVILAPNHCGTLMDAMVVLLTHRKPIVFGARADIFDNRTVSSILRFLRILPMVRKRDGIRKVLRNYETIDQAVDVLSNGVPFCMYAEGTHRTKHSILPLNKGIFRIALAAHAALDANGGRDVYIVPGGIEYGDYFHFRSWCRLRYGSPVNVSKYVREHPEMAEPEIMAALRTRLASRMAGQITFFPDDENYDASWDAFQKRYQSIYGKTYRDAGYPHKRLARIMLAVLTSPFFALSALLTLPMWGIGEFLCHKKVKDRAFRNTARYAMKLLGNVIFGIVWAIVFFNVLPWWGAIAALCYFWFSYSIFYDWLNLIRK